MTKSKFSASFIVAPSIFVIHLVSGAEFLNATCATWCPIIVIIVINYLLLKCKHRCNQKD